MINKIPAWDVPETPHQLKVSSPSVGGVMSLDDGAHYFAENRKATKVVNKTSLEDIVDNFNLPKDVVDRLRGSNV